MALDNITWDAAGTQVQLALNEYLSHIVQYITPYLWPQGMQGHNLLCDIKSRWAFRDTQRELCTKGICKQSGWETEHGQFLQPGLGG